VHIVIPVYAHIFELGEKKIRTLFNETQHDTQVHNRQENFEHHKRLVTHPLRSPSC